MKTDQAFRDQVASAPDDTARLEVINAAGFAVSAEDRDTLVEAIGTADGELSDAQLEGIAGGVSSACFPGHVIPALLPFPPR